MALWRLFFAAGLCRTAAVRVRPSASPQEPKLPDEGLESTEGLELTGWEEPEQRGFPPRVKSRQGNGNCMMRAPRFDSHWRSNCPVLRPNNEGQSSWLDLPPVEGTTKKPPKLALMMTIYDTITHADMWSAWLRSADEAGLNYSLVIHKKKQEEPLKKGQELERFLLNRSATTEYCRATTVWQLMIGMGLKDQDVTHFATITGDSIPLKPLSQIYAHLSKNPASRMCMDFDFGWRVRAETWWVMRRADAALLHKHQTLVATSFPVVCADEELWMKPLALRSCRDPDSSPLVNECVMFTDWTGQCRDWANHNDLGNFTHLRTKERYRNSKEAHPRMYLTLSKASLAELEASPFWFARKFL